MGRADSMEANRQGPPALGMRIFIIGKNKIRTAISVILMRSIGSMITRH